MSALIGYLPEHFNPLPRKEGDFWKTIEKKRSNYFNPLPRKEGDQYVPLYRK